MEWEALDMYRCISFVIRRLAHNLLALDFIWLMIAVILRCYFFVVVASSIVRKRRLPPVTIVSFASTTPVTRQMHGL